MIVLVYAHKFLMVLAVCLLIYAVTKAHARADKWFETHKKFATIGAACGLFGFSAIVLFKLVMAYPHFKTIHSLAGLVAVLSLTGAPLAGRLLASGKRSLRLMHITGGRFAVLISIISVLLKVF